MPTTVRGGTSGLDANVDEALNLFVSPIAIPGYPTAGGFYTVAGRSGTAGIAAALATDTTLMSARLATGSTRRAYITKIRVSMSNLVVGVSAGVPSVLGVQKFTTATPTGGTARTAARLGDSKGSASDITDIRDNNAALTVTSVVFADEIAWLTTPTNGALAAINDLIFEPVAPVELSAGQGICLRTRQVGPATATWYFAYTMHWFER